MANCRSAGLFAAAIFPAALIAIAIAAPCELAAQNSEERADRIFAEAYGWIYDDLEAGFKQARQTGQPLMVVIRCPP